MKRVLVITPCVGTGLPTQSALVAAHLRDAGFRVGLLTKARSRLGRLLDVLFRAFWLIPLYDAVLIDVFGERAFVYESFAILCSAFWRRRSVVVLRNGMLPDFVERWSRWTKFVLSWPDSVIVPHGFLRERLATMSIRIDVVIPNFVDLDSYRYRKRSSVRPKFLYLRGMYSIYNPQMALRAFAVVQRRYPDASLTMAGRDGPELQACRRLVTELGLHQVSFVGMVPKAEISDLAAHHDIHLHTNRLENMPVTIIEMWACGVPIVGTAVGGMPYLVRDGIDAMLVTSDDHEAMAAASFKILSDPQLAERLSVRGRARAQDLTWSRVRSMWEQALFGDAQTAHTPNRAAADALTSPRPVEASPDTTAIRVNS